MANFSVSISATSDTTAALDGYFSGGDASYTRYRYIKLTIGGVTLPYIRSDEAGGAESDFTYTLQGLSPHTRYTWTAELYYIASGEYISTGLTDSGSFWTEESPPEVYSVEARKSTNSGEGIASVSVSQSEAEEGESVRFTATLNAGYVFVCWATNDGAPTVSTIVSTDSDFWYPIYEDTTLYAYAGRPQSGVNIVAVRDGEWHPASIVVVATKNGVKQWRNTKLACVDGSEWKS